MVVKNIKIDDSWVFLCRVETLSLEQGLAEGRPLDAMVYISIPTNLGCVYLEYVYLFDPLKHFSERIMYQG